MNLSDPLPKRNHILACIPHYGKVEPEFSESVLTPLHILQDDYDRDIMMLRGIKNLDIERNLMVEAMLKNPSYTHVLFIDTDVIPEEPLDINESVRALLSMNAPITSALMRAKRGADAKEIDERKSYTPKEYALTAGFNYAMWKKVKEENGVPVFSPVDDWNGNWLEVDAISMGFCLIQRAVFEKIPYPWFKWGDSGTPSEDFYFCGLARAAGYEINVFADVKFSHIAVVKVRSDGKIVIPNL